MKRFVVFSLALASLIAVGWWLWEEDGAVPLERITVNPLPKVAVIHQTPSLHQTTLSAYGRLTPRWSVTVKAAVSGTVTDWSSLLLVGQSVKKGKNLLRLHNPDNTAQVALIRQQLADAKVQQQQLLQEIRQMRRDWKLSGVKGNRHTIAIHEARKAAATQVIKTAKEQLKAAKTTVNDAQVRAPFTGIIREVFIAPGQRIEQGDALLTLSEQHHLQLMVTLDETQSQRLAGDWRGQRVVIQDTTNQPLAVATLREGKNWVTTDTGLYPFFLDVAKDTNNAQLPPAGTLVKAILPSKPLPRSVVIPNSAYTRDQHVWYVDKAQQLRFFTPAISHHDGQSVLVQLPDDWKDETIAIATLPLSDWMMGMPVEAVEQDTAAKTPNVETVTGDTP